MGGVVRTIAKAVGLAPKKAPAPAPAPVAQTAAPAAAKAEAKAAEAQTAKAATAIDKGATLGAGYGGQTMMTGAAGVEEEANVAKTVLGGASSGGRRKKGKSNYGAA
jgi:hypothetical protein